jgi:hypothetical protein
VKVGAAPHHPGRAEPLEKPVERAGARLERVDAARRAEVGERDARKWLRSVGEDTDPHAAGREDA